MKQNPILETLTHRYPFLMVDKIVSTSEDAIITQKNVSMNEPQFSGHFPNNPIFPGVLIIEFMAQSCGLFLRYAYPEKFKNRLGFLVGINKVKFYTKIIPGDILICEVHFKEHVMDFLKFNCTVKKDNDKAASGQITLLLEN